MRPVGLPAQLPLTGGTSDGRGRIYVLDRGDNKIKTFDTTGLYLGSAGHPGHDAGGFIVPLALAHDEGHSLYVVDGVTGVSKFDTSADSIAFKSRFGLDLNAKGVCAIKNLVIIAGWRDGMMVHEFSVDGELVQSFGDGFNADPNWNIRRFVNGRMGPVMGCDGASGHIYLTSVNSGEARAYDTTGRLLWTSELPNHRATRYKAQGSGIATVYGRFLTQNVISLTPNVLLIQAHHREREIRRSRSGNHAVLVDRGVVTYVLDATTGQVLGVNAGLPVIAWRKDNASVTYDDQPYPQFIVRSISIAPSTRSRQ